MTTQTSSLDLPFSSTSAWLETSTSQLKAEYEVHKELYSLQPEATQRALEIQAGKIAEGYLKKQPRIQISLPEQVLGYSSKRKVIELPIRADLRQQTTGGLVKRLMMRDGRIMLRELLAGLERNTDPGVSTGARLIRFAAANTMINQLIPTGGSVVYTAPDVEDIPHVPVDGFFLPQWIAFDGKNKLLVSSTEEAEACLESMQNYMGVLGAATTLAPYMVADQGYQTKRYGMLGQLVNQGRAMAVYETDQIIQRLKRRAVAQELNMGLHLSQPYFDDQALQIQLWTFMVIPAGRTLFVPAFVVMAAHREKANVARNPRLSISTRKHLMKMLESLEVDFI